MTPYVVPSLFNNNWQPQIMPATNMALQNNFNNFNLSNLGGGQQYPPSNYPQNNQQQNFGQQGQQQNFNQTPNMGQTPGYGQGQNMGHQQGQNNQFENSGMGMNNNPYGGRGY